MCLPNLKAFTVRYNYNRSKQRGIHGAHMKAKYALSTLLFFAYGAGTATADSSLTCPDIPGKQAQEIMCPGEGISKVGTVLSDGYSYTRGLQVASLLKYCASGPRSDTTFHGTFVSEGSVCKYTLPNGKSFSVSFNEKKECPEVTDAQLKKEILAHAKHIKEGKLINVSPLPGGLNGGSMERSSAAVIMAFNGTLTAPLQGKHLHTKKCTYPLSPKLLAPFDVTLTGVEQD